MKLKLYIYRCFDGKNEWYYKYITNIELVREIWDRTIRCELINKAEITEYELEVLKTLQLLSDATITDIVDLIKIDDFINNCKIPEDIAYKLLMLAKRDHDSEAIKLLEKYCIEQNDESKRPRIYIMI